MPTDPVRTVVSYLLSVLLDAFDGHAARLLDQSMPLIFRQIFAF